VRAIGASSNVKKLLVSLLERQLIFLLKRDDISERTMSISTDSLPKRRGSAVPHVSLGQGVPEEVRAMRSRVDSQIYQGALPIKEEWLEIGAPADFQGDYSSELVVAKRGKQYGRLIARLQDLEEKPLPSPRFLVGVASQRRKKKEAGRADFVTFVFQFTPGKKDIEVMKLTMAYSQIFTQLVDLMYADIVVSDLHTHKRVIKKDLMQMERTRGSVYVPPTPNKIVQVENLSINFISQNAELLNTWDRIRHDMASNQCTWMVLGYHPVESTAFGAESELNVNKALPAPVLLASGGGGIDGFGSSAIVDSVDFRPGWLYWIYARVDVEMIEGTGSFREKAQVQGSGETAEHDFRGAKFLLVSFCTQQSLLPSMTTRLLKHRPVIVQVLKYHLYVEARSIADLDESVIVNRLLALSGGNKIVLTVIVGSGSGGTLKRIVKAAGNFNMVSSPLLIRVDPKSTLKELKSRIAATNQWDVEKVVIMRIKRKKNEDVMSALISVGVRARSERDLAEILRKASSQVDVENLKDDDKTLAELGLRSGEELYIQQSKSQNNRASQRATQEINSVSLVERRRAAIEEFLNVKEKQQKFRAPMFTSLRNIAEAREAEDEEDDDEQDSNESKESKESPHARRKASARNVFRRNASNRRQSAAPKERPSVTKEVQINLRKKSALGSDMATMMAAQLKMGRKQLKNRRSKGNGKESAASNAAEMEQRVQKSDALLGLLTEEAVKLGARLVDEEDLIILNKRPLGDGRTARVREGVLLCRNDQLPDPKLAARKSTAIGTRASWSRMRKNSFALDHLVTEENEDEVERRKSAGESSIDTAEDDQILDFIALKVAVKMFTAKIITQTVFDQFQEEISCLVGLTHPSIVQIVGVHVDTATRRQDTDHPSLMIMYELMPRGSLRQLREKDEWPRIPFPLKLKMALDVARGIEYLHSCDPPVAHRDLKSDNLLVDEDFTLKIGDFGNSIRWQPDGSGIYGKVGTAGWTAPEVLLSSEAGYDIYCDIYSFGIILWELITSEGNPLAGRVEDEYIKSLRKGDRPILPDDADPTYAALVEDCWKFEPLERPNASEVVDRLKVVLDANFD